jgi:hypothetical protein
MGSAVWPLKNNGFIKTLRNNTSDTWYKVDLYEDKGLTVALKAQIDSGYLELFLYNEDGKQLSYKSASDGKYATVGIKADKDTTVYVRVSGSKGIYYLGFYDHYYNSEASQNDERDFYGALNTAQKIINGNIERSDEELKNYYRVDVKEGQSLSVSMMPQIDSGYLEIRLYNSDGEQLSYKSASNGKVATVTKKASTDCTYFIAVTGSKGKYTLSYTIN